MITIAKTPAETIATWAREGARLGDCGHMCGQCAFKPGAAGNNEEHNVEKALQCLAWGGQFNCHKNEEEDAGYPCAGFLYAKQHLDNRFKKKIEQ